MAISALGLRWGALLVGPVLLLGTSVWVHGSSETRESAPARYARRPPLGHTGGFGEPTCHACHFGSEVNEGGGRLTVEGLSGSVRPDSTYRLTVALAASMERSGFMMAVRHPDGTQAGRLRPIDSVRVAVRTDGSTDVQYASHRRDGTDPVEPNRAAWSVRWTAPPAGDTVIVHVAANAANDDASAFGDDIYTTTKQVGIEK